MKIYTRKGDRGVTSLFGGDRVSKSSARIEAYGSVDELNSLIGLVLSYNLSGKGLATLQKVQEQLLILGADLATPFSSENRIERLGEDDILFLEDAIDEMEKELPALKNFILPGGSRAGATLHVARTICRRAERAVVECSQTEKVSDMTVKYLNRLSDLLFVAARFENRYQGAEETVWKPERKDGGK